MEINKDKRPIVYWGIGNVCKQCLEEYPSCKPVFFVDSFSRKKQYNGIEILKPASIDNWGKYFVVIVIDNFYPIANYMEKAGLKEGIDFCHYKEFFNCGDLSTGESLEIIKKYRDTHKSGAIMINAPIFSGRVSRSLEKFWSVYVQARNKEGKECVVFTQLRFLSMLEASDRLGCTVFDNPDICRYENIDKEYKTDTMKKVVLSDTEHGWLKALELRKISENKESALRYITEIYCYYKLVIETLMPSKIIIWGNWMATSYILGYLAKMYGIDCGYMEHGWIPGTVQFDRGGIAGQSEYARNPDVLNKILIKKENIDNVEVIKKYIIDSKLDTGAFDDTEWDAHQMQKMDLSKKTVFLVGMDETGMKMNPQSEYWRCFISSIYEKMSEVLNDLEVICEANDWNLIYKPHPDNREFEGSKRVIYVKDKSIDELIQISDVVVSMASAVDFKVLMYEKPLVQVGITGLKEKGCSYEVKERKDLGNVVRKAMNEGMTKLQKENYNVFLARLLKKYLWDDLSDRELRYGRSIEEDF